MRTSMDLPARFASCEPPAEIQLAASIDSLDPFPAEIALMDAWEGSGWCPHNSKPVVRKGLCVESDDLGKDSLHLGLHEPGLGLRSRSQLFWKPLSQLLRVP